MARLCALALVAALGCGSTASTHQPASPTEAKLDAEPREPEPAAQPAPENESTEPAREVARPDLDEVLDQGPGAFLGRLEVRPYFDGKKFAGWELVAFKDPASRLASAGLEPGDVVKRVNAHRLERPEHLQKLGYELRSAHIIVVEGLRAGEPFELHFAVATSTGAPAVPAAAEGS
jgi:type II secretory pathway component PulC